MPNSIALRIDLESDAAKKAITDLLASFKATEAQTASLAKKFAEAGATGAESTNLAKAAMQQFAASQAQAEAAAKRLGDESAKAAEKAAKAATESAKASVEAAKKLADGAKLANETGAKLFAKGIGEELPERLGDISTALKIARGHSDDFDGGVATLGNRLKAGAGAAMLAGSTLMHFGTAAVDVASKLLTLAAAHDEVQRQTARMGEEYSRVQASTAGAVSASDAFAARSALIRQGVDAQGDSLATLTRAGREYADQFGGTGVQATQAFMAAAQSADNTALAPFHIRIQDTGTAAGNLRAALAALAAQQAGSPVAPPSASEQLETFTRQIKEAAGAVTLYSTGPLRTLTGGIQDAVSWVREQTGSTRSYEDVVRNLDSQLRDHNAAEAVAAEQARHVAIGIKQADSAMRQMAEGAKLAASATLNMNFALSAGELPVDRLTRRLQAARNIAAQAREQHAEDAQLRRQLSREGVNLADAGLAVAGGGPRARTNAQLKADAARSLATAQDNATAAEDARAKAQGLADIAFAEQAYADQAQANAQELIANDRLKIQAAQALVDTVTAAERAKQQAMQQTMDVGFQATRAFQQMAELQQTGAQALGSVMQSTWGAMTGALKSHIQALILGKETIGEALKGILHETLLSLATEAAVQAVMQTAIGIGKLAGSFGADPTAYGHFASAAAFAAVAGLAGVGAAATIPSAASAGSSAGGSRGAPGPAASAGSTPATSNGGSNVTYVYQVNGNTYHREQSADEVASMMRDAMSRGTA